MHSTFKILKKQIFKNTKSHCIIDTLKAQLIETWPVQTEKVHFLGAIWQWTSLCKITELCSSVCPLTY